MPESRWVNWDQVAVGEDLWDLMDELDGKRLTEEALRRQQERLRRARERRVDRMNKEKRRNRGR